MSDYEVGELVDVTIRRAWVTTQITEGHDADVTSALQVTIPTVDGLPYYMVVPIGTESVKIERVAPEYSPGQVLRDRDGDLWMAFERKVDYDTESVVGLVCATTKGRPTFDNDTIVQQYGPLVPVVIEP